MTWMQRLKHVFGIDSETCERCGAKVKVIASIAAQAVSAHILKHLKQSKPMESRLQVRQPCFAVKAKIDENQPECPPESLLKDKQEGACQD